MSLEFLFQFVWVLPVIFFLHGLNEIIASDPGPGAGVKGNSDSGWFWVLQIFRVPSYLDEFSPSCSKTTLLVTFLQVTYSSQVLLPSTSISNTSGKRILPIQNSSNTHRGAKHGSVWSSSSDDGRPRYFTSSCTTSNCSWRMASSCVVCQQSWSDSQRFTGGSKRSKAICPNPPQLTQACTITLITTYN